MAQMRKYARRTQAALTALLLAMVLTACAATPGMQDSPSPIPEGDKQITAVIIHGDGTRKEIPIETSQDTLGRALVEAGVVEGNGTAYGIYIVTADGERADEDKEQWWCITKGGEGVNTGADSTPIEDGDVFELTFTTGWS